MVEIERRIAQMAARVAKVETLVRSLREQNRTLREALERRPPVTAEGSGAVGESAGLRLAALEAEREEVRSRLSGLLGAL